MGDAALYLLSDMSRGVTADGRLGHHGLQKAAAVPQDQEVDLAARPAVVEPPFDRALLALVRADAAQPDGLGCPP